MSENFDCRGALSHKYDIDWITKQLFSLTVYSGAVFFDFHLLVCLLIVVTFYFSVSLFV